MQEPPSHYPKDIGTALAATIGMLFTINLTFSAFHSDQLTIQQLQSSHWSTIEITKEELLNFNFLEFRTGDITMFIKQGGYEIYEQPCKNFKQLCLNIQKNVVHPQTAVFYSDTPQLTMNTTLYLKSLQFIDEHNQKQSLDIRPLLPNNPIYIEQQRKNSASRFLWIGLLFLLFGMGGYFNHIGRYIKNYKIVKKINLFILIFYSCSCVYFFIQYLRL